MKVLYQILNANIIIEEVLSIMVMGRTLYYFVITYWSDMTSFYECSSRINLVPFL